MQKYQFGKKLGSGGFGTVYSAVDKTGQEFAIKVLEKGKINLWHKTGAGRMPMEVAVMRALQGVSGVVQLQDYCDDGHRVFIFMEKPQGSVDLLKYLHQMGPLPEEAALVIFGQLARILSKMEEAGIVHGDVKLENVLVNPNTLEIHVIDFGLSYFLREIKGALNTFRGTTSYAPPEWFLSGLLGIRQAQVWSLGVLLYALVTGNLPFSDRQEVVLKGLKVPKGFTKELGHILRSTLRKCLKRRMTLQKALHATSKWMKEVKA